VEIKEYIRQNPYPGRGIFVGLCEDGSQAVLAYFITGRSENSKNRVLVSDGDGAITKAFDESKVSDPSLIFYSPVRVFNGRTVISNGDQTDTIVSFLEQGKTFDEALQTREEEPDAPHYTPRISAIVDTKDKLSCRFSILRREDGETVREFTEYNEFEEGFGRLLHTYAGDGSPLPSFTGEPKLLCFSGKKIVSDLWEELGKDRRVALWVRTVDLATGATETTIRNRYEEGNA
jgi:IMP cyclohydrolase